MLPVGSLINAAAVVVGGALGLAVHGKISDRFQETLVHGLGLCVLVIGVQSALKLTNPIPIIFSLVLGGIIGELCRIQDRLNGLADVLKKALRSDSAHFSEGLVTAFLIFCIGPMTILGSFDEGLRHDATVLLTKSMLDGCGSVALAATYGVGVLFSIVPLLLFQLSLTYFAFLLTDLFTPAMITQLTATGGVLILGIGVNMLGMQKIRLSNLLPSLVLIVLITWAMAHYQL